MLCMSIEILNDNRDTYVDWLLCLTALFMIFLLFFIKKTITTFFIKKKKKKNFEWYRRGKIGDAKFYIHRQHIILVLKHKLHF